ncbi:MAG TPA: hypothetical protein VGJ00_01215 [Rhabdochlamydiaceae bacterium]|jgi:hypothetical protein
MAPESEQSYLKALKDSIDTLKNSLPWEIPLVISKAIDPCRAHVLREACLHRITELAGSTYDAFQKNKLITAFTLCRSVMETESLFWEFTTLLEDALKKKSVSKIRKFLTKAMLGAKIQTRDGTSSMTPHHILTLVRDGLGKQVKGYFNQYEFLSEFAHPNAAGVIKAYVQLDWEKHVAYLGLNQNKIFPDLALPTLVVSLQAFIRCYDNSAQLLSQFIPLCESLLEQGKIPQAEHDVVL